MSDIKTIPVPANVLADGHPLRVVWHTPPRYGIAEHPADGTRLTIVGAPTPRGETNALWVPYVYSPPGPHDMVEWAPLACFSYDVEAIEKTIAEHIHWICAEVKKSAEAARIEHEKQLHRDFGAWLCCKAAEYNGASADAATALRYYGEEIREGRIVPTVEPAADILADWLR